MTLSLGTAKSVWLYRVGEWSYLILPGESGTWSVYSHGHLVARRGTLTGAVRTVKEIKRSREGAA